MDWSGSSGDEDETNSAVVNDVGEGKTSASQRRSSRYPMCGRAMQISRNSWTETAMMRRMMQYLGWRRTSMTRANVSRHHHLISLGHPNTQCVCVCDAGYGSQLVWPDLWEQLVEHDGETNHEIPGVMENTHRLGEGKTSPSQRRSSQYSMCVCVCVLTCRIWKSSSVV